MTSDTADTAPSLSRPMPRLLLASASALFLELAVIRWSGGHLLYLSYVANFVLLAAFLGLGLGCLLAALRGADRVDAWVGAVPPLLLLLVAAVGLFEVEVVIKGEGVVYFQDEVQVTTQRSHALPAWLVLPGFGLLVTALFTAMGTAVGRELGRARPLVAYSTDIAGSLLGIALFAAASWFEVPAYGWFVAAGLAWLPLVPARRSWLYGGVASVALAAGLVTWVDAGSVWSPYYRVGIDTLEPRTPRFVGDPTARTPHYRLRVNSISHQEISAIRRRQGESFYEFPYRAAGARVDGLPPDRYLTSADPRDWRPVRPGEPVAHNRWRGRVLIIGAGTGSDVACALAYGASHVDAVEIDPVLARTGRALHPDRPYHDPRVTVHVTDARAFLERATGTYDLVIYGLPDSLTLASPYAGLRLESFLFTIECFQRAAALLDPERGLLVLYNYYRERWLVDRIARALTEATGGPPLVMIPRRPILLPAVFVAGPGQAGARRQLDAPGWVVTTPGRDVGPLPTDDWPFLYLRERRVPRHLGLSMLAMIAVALLAIGGLLLYGRSTGAGLLAGASPGRALREAIPFFLMGIAFLLLETTGLVRMALLFGNTWFVNSLVFFAVLTMVLVANLIASRVRLPRLPLFGLILVALGVAWAVRPAALAGWPVVPRYIGASALLFVPILLANLAFAGAFKHTPRPALVFGANLVGAVVGGALEYSSLMLGYQALFVVAGALYALAGLTAGPAWRAEADAAAAQ